MADDFPANVVTALKEEIAAQIPAPDLTFTTGRPLRPNDPNRSVGIFAVDWTPEQSNIGQHDPAVARYLYAISCLIKNADEEAGLKEHTDLSKRIRTMLYRSGTLRARLGALSVTMDGMTERAQRWGVRQQRFLSNEVQGTFLFLSSIEFWLETETV